MKSKYNKSNKNKREILILLTQDLESPSGIGRFFPLSKNLVKQGFSVSIAALHSDFDSLEDRTFWQEGVKVVYVAQMHVKKENNKTKYFRPTELLWHTIKATWNLFRYVLRNPADVIVIGKPHPMNSIAGLLGGWLMGSKIILDCDDYEAESNYFSSTWQKWIIEVFENFTPKLVHQVTTNTMFNKNRMIDLGISPYKIDYLPNGVDKERFSGIDKEQVERIAADLHLLDQKVVAYIGSLSLSNHPVDLLLQSFKLIIENEPNAILLIVGGGKDLITLQKMAIELQIEKNVIFTGRVLPNLVPHYYEIAAVTVDPVFETNTAKGRCPLKMFESWIMETPFVTADVGDRRFLAGEPPSALFAKPGDSEDLTEQLYNILSNPDLAEELVCQGKMNVSNYTWEILSIKFQNTIEDLLSKS
jgi:glycosyltransferase involved in cell wall biosynthesis